MVVERSATFLFHEEEQREEEMLNEQLRCGM